MNLKKLYLVLAFIAAGCAAFAVGVNEGELKSAGNADTIVFENYTGPHSVINTLAEIQGIGLDLGKQVAAELDSNKTFGSSSKYSVIHCVDPKEEGKLDADIFVLGPNASVDHIKNLRRIIAAYLRAAYGYSDADSDTIATFVTVYNAVYRGNMKNFESKYKNAVTKNLESSKLGLAISYKEWPGKTQIVIPLGDVRGGLSTVDTSVISDKEVVKSMQEDDDKGIDSRKQMVDIKEREADNAQTRATEAQKKAAEERAKAEQSKKDAEAAQKEADVAQKDADAAQKEADAAQKEADEAKKNAEENPDDEQAQKDAQAAQENADQKAAEASEAQKTADEAKQEAEDAQKQAEESKEAQKQAEKDAAAAQSEADKKRSEAQAERSSIAQDQQQVINEQRKNDSAPSAYGLKILDESGSLAGLVRMNANTGSVIKESPVNVIRNRTLLEKGNVFIAIAGVNSGKGAIKLVQIDKETLEIAKETNEVLTEASVLVEDGGSYFCVIDSGKDGCFVGKFSSDLDLLAKSEIAVKPATPIIITAGGVMVTSSDAKAVLLKLNDLTELK